jgi:dGTPase
MDKNDICMSPEVADAMTGLRQYMFDNLYRGSVAKAEEAKAKELLRRLFQYYMEHVELMPEQFTRMMDEGVAQDRVVCDYIAGMTDQYAIAKFNEYFVPLAWQVN